MAKITPQDLQNIVDGLLAEAQKIKPASIKVPVSRIKQGKKFDEEEFILVLSDLQVGHKTKTFNFNVFNQRMGNLIAGVNKVTQIHRTAHPVKILNVFMLGDLIQSERIGYLVSLDQLEAELKVQLFDVAIPAIAEALKNFLGEFDKVRVFCVRGNHGGNGKFAATNTNWDDVGYMFLKQMFRDEPRINFEIADNFYQIVKVMNTRFMLAHGDQIPMYMNIPAYGITQRLMRWQGSVGDFDFLVLGHFHNFVLMDWNDKQFLVNGTFVTDDAWVQQKLGLRGSCSQTLMGVHPRIGVSFVRKVYLDKK